MSEKRMLVILIILISVIIMPSIFMANLLVREQINRNYYFYLGQTAGCIESTTNTLAIFIFGEGYDRLPEMTQNNLLEYSYNTCLKLLEATIGKYDINYPPSDDWQEIYDTWKSNGIKAIETQVNNE